MTPLLKGVALAAMSAMSTLPAIAASPGLPELRSTLAVPLESGFVEADIGASGTLEGYFDSYLYARNNTDDPNLQKVIMDRLDQNGFVTGYGRVWFIPNKSDWLEELVMVFGDHSSAVGEFGSQKIDYQRNPDFGSPVDVSMIPGAFGLTEIANGYHWTVVMFVKGNDFYSVARASASDPMTAQGVDQAANAYATAPHGTAVENASTTSSGWTRYMRLAVIGGLLFASSVAIVVIAIIYVGVSRRRRGLTT